MKGQLEHARISNAASSFNWFWNTKLLSNEPKFNSIYLKNNLSKIKDGAYVVNLDEYKLVETHWIAWYVNKDNVTYFDSFGNEHIPKEIKKFISNKNIETNSYRIQGNDSIISGYFCFLFVDVMPKDKSLLDFKTLVSSKKYDRNDNIILKDFQQIKISFIKVKLKQHQLYYV